MREKFYISFIGLFSILYGGVIYFFPQEAITFAKTFLGDYNYNQSNTWYIGILSSPITLQTYLHYFFLKLGVNEEYLNIIHSVLTCYLSFLTLFYLAKVLDIDNYSAFLILLLFLFFRFIDTHWYGIYYPVNYFYFGQMGMYLTILSLVHYCLNKKNLSIFLLILNIFAHAAWGSINFVLLSVLFIQNKEAPKINFYHLIFFISILFLMIYVYIDFDQFLNNSFSQYENGINTFRVKDEGEIKAYSISHSPYFFIDYKSIFNAFRFFFYEILLITIFIIFRKKINENTKKLLSILIISTIIVCLTYFTNQLTDIFSYLGFINKSIPELLNRMLMTRFLNMNNIFVLVFSIAYLFFKSKNESLNFPKIYLTIYFILISCFIIINGNIIVEHIPIIKLEKIFNNIFIWVNFPIALAYCVFELKIEKKLNFYPRLINIKKFYKFSINIYLILIIFYLLPLKYKNFTDFTQSNEKVFDLIDNKSFKEIIVGPLIYGYIDPSYISNSPIFLPLNYINSIIDNKKIDVWCDNARGTFNERNDYFNYVYFDCLQIKTNDEWKDIGKQLNSNYVLVRSYVELNLKLVGKNEFISLYSIN